ncbi:hypothetical protein PIB30_066510 [Stylosanthes scabra]|uniref:Uncharacterized protein n=1 Tax=Stylosanthes scabra TaxID=79078 RepID=A0ABU6WMB4_9FABA|nr:hypothetical protein [Stylosanthes scabra]
MVPPNNSSNISQPSNSRNLPSQPLSNPWGSIGTVFLCTNREGREDVLLNEEDVEKTDDQLGALDGVLDKKEENPAELDSEFNAYGGYLHKLHNNRAKVGALSSRKHLGPWKFQDKLVDSHGNG